MNSRITVRRQSQTSRLCLSLLSAATALGATPAPALLFTGQLATSTAEELDAVTGSPATRKLKRAPPSRPMPMFSWATA